MTTLARPVLHTALPRNMAFDVSLQSRRIRLNIFSARRFFAARDCCATYEGCGDMAVMLFPQGLPQG
jgi:hypothetical protein